MLKKCFLAACFCSPFLLAAAPLSIPEEKPFTTPVPFPAAQFPSGRLHKSLAPEWKVISLDGMWKFKEVPFVKSGPDSRKDSGMAGGYWKESYPDGAWADIEVPSGWYHFPKYHTPEGKTGYYRRRFDLTGKQLDGQRFILDFRRVADRADVWVNGIPAGPVHVGRETSFQYDVTNLLKPGKNQLAVRVYDYVGHKSYQRRNLGGICDSVRLFSFPGAFYVPRVMATPDLKNSSVGLQIQTMVPPGAAAVKGLGVEIYDAAGKKAGHSFRSDLRFAPGTNWIDFGRIGLKNPRLWSPEDPHLYTIRLTDAAGKTVGFETFGFREFKADGEWLMLNGKKFKPRMHTFCAWNGEQRGNLNQTMEKMIRFFKDRMHVNMLRPHSGEGMHFESFFELCDRIGMLVYVDWTGATRHQAYDKKWNDSILESAPELMAFIRDTYGHPSIAMWSFGNEIYESHYGLFFSKNLDRQYGMVKALDRQNRPVCSSTGRQTLEGMQAGLLKERTDVADDHQYRGSYCGSWQENIAHIDAYAEVARKYYGPIPKVNAEYGVPGDCARYRDVTATEVAPLLRQEKRNTVEFKEAYAKLLRDPRAEVGGYLRYKSNFATPDDYIDKKGIYRKFASRYAKRPMEIYRRAGVKCLGGHTNAQWYDIMRDFPSGWRNISDAPRSPSSTWMLMPLYYETVRCYNPTLVSAGVFNQHPYAGRTESVEIFVTNDRNDSGDFEVRPQFRPENAPVQEFPALKFGSIGPMDQKSLPFRYATPATKTILRGRLEFYLFRNGTRVGDNFYDLTVFPPRRPAALPERCALYDSAGVKYRGLLKTPTTLRLLKDSGARFHLIRNFDSLNEYTHLILGANSFDRVVLENGDRIFKWVENGGKLLVFEQTLCGKVPFLANYSIVSGNPGTHVTIVDRKHPVFRTIRQEEMDSWSGDLGRMAACAISPLDAGMVAVLPLAASADPDCYKAALCDVRLGKGEIILSQIAVSNRLKESGIAGEYLCSLLEYFSAPGVSEHALPLSNAKSGKVLYLDNKDAMFLDISKAANRSFSDEKAGDRIGGWTDFGASADFRSIPVGVSRLQGGVPFRILDPAKNNGTSCIVLKGTERPYFPERVTGIPVDALLNSFYVLHTAMYARDPGVAVRYILHYEDGKTQEFAADTRYDLPDWWMAKSVRNGTPVFRDGNRSLFMSEFINPRPNVKIRTLDIVGGNKAIPVIVAITGRVRLSSTISGVGEK